MSRLTLLVLVVVVLIAALFLLSTMAKERPRHTIEIAVPQGGNAR
jgi:hypothetical protein